MNASHERTDHELREALAAVGHEIRMMASSAVRANAAQDDAIALNAYVTASHLHARLLIDFFLMPGHATDIKRTQFGPEWAAAPADAADRLQAHLPMMHKYLAHLTWERVRSDSPNFDYPGIFRDVLNVANGWLAHLKLKEPNGLHHDEVLRPHVELARAALDRVAS